MSNADPDRSAASRHFIIGTAGHVDHGKTALIRALTGAETDRLREERERGMSIDLGFADFTLPSGRHAGVIDVPGHERFLKNMLAGAGGIDLVLLVIAADEGVMPQTREHLDILNVLRTRRGVVVLTKADLVEPEWLELVQEEIREFLQGTFLADAPMLPVSSITGQGIPELKALLDQMAAEVPTRPIVGAWRLPIDRVFTVGGFGTVVTGTLIAGVARTGDAVEILPERLETRIRGLQSFGQAVDYAEAGTRVAINLAGVSLEDVERGDVAAPPAVHSPTLALDARVEVLPGCSRPLKHRTRVRVYLGAAEILARLNLLEGEALEPGQNGLVQLRLETPTVAVKGERFVLRFYSPMETIGGGSVLDAEPAKHRRSDRKVLDRLAVQESGTPAELVAHAVTRSGLTPVRAERIAAELGMPLSEVSPLVEELLADGRLVGLEAGLLHAHSLQAAEHQVLTALSAYHEANPMRAGMSREELRSRLARTMDAKGFGRVLARMEANGTVVSEGGRVRSARHTAVFTAEQETARQAILNGLLTERFNPPAAIDLQAGLPAKTAADVWDALVDNGDIVRISAGVFLHREAIGEAVERVRAYLTEHGTMTASEFRDLLGTTRKYAVPLLEYLDAQRVTRRRDDLRELF